MLAGRNSSPDPVVVPYAPEAGSTPVWWEGLTEPCPCFPRLGPGAGQHNPRGGAALVGGVLSAEAEGGGVQHLPVASSLKGARPGQAVEWGPLRWVFGKPVESLSFPSIRWR